MDEVYAEHFGKFSEDFGSFGIEVDNIRSTVLPISTIKSITKSIDQLSGYNSTNLKSDETEKEVRKIKFEEHMIESYENAFLRMMGMPNEINILGKEVLGISNGKLYSFEEGSEEGPSIYSIFSKRDAASTDRIGSNRSESLVTLSQQERDTTYFSKQEQAELQRSIDFAKKTKETKEKSLKDNESLDEEKLKFIFLKKLASEPNFSNLVDEESDDISFGKSVDENLIRIFRSEVLGEEIPRKNLLNYGKFLLDEASLLFPPVQDSRIEYCLSESDKIVSKPFDIGNSTVNRNEVGISLLESVIRIRLDSVVGTVKDRRSGKKSANNIEFGDSGITDPTRNPDAFSTIEKIIIDRLNVALLNLSDSFFELTQNYYKACKKAKLTLSEILSVEDHLKTGLYIPEGSTNVSVGEEERTLRLLKNIDDTILILLEKGRWNSREFGTYKTSSVYDGAAMNTLLKVITIPSTYADKKLKRYNNAIQSLANGKNGVLDTSVKLSHIAGLKRGVGIIDLICFGLAFFTIEQKHLIGLLDDKQIKRMKKELGIIGKVEASSMQESMYYFSKRLAEAYSRFASQLSD